MRQGFPIACKGMVIGLLGGSFDPAHEGHVHITHEAIKRIGLHQVWWLVTPANPLKPRQPAPMTARLVQARAVMCDPRVKITQLETLLHPAHGGYGKAAQGALSGRHLCLADGRGQYGAVSQMGALAGYFGRGASGRSGPAGGGGGRADQCGRADLPRKAGGAGREPALDDRAGLGIREPAAEQRLLVCDQGAGRLDRWAPEMILNRRALIAGLLGATAGPLMAQVQGAAPLTSPGRGFGRRAGYRGADPRCQAGGPSQFRRGAAWGGRGVG